MQRHEQRYRIGERIRRLNELGFDVDEVELIEDPGGGSRLKLTHPRGRARATTAGVLFARTGLDVQENQARRLLADIASVPRLARAVRAATGPGGGRGEPVAHRGLRAGGRARSPPHLRTRLDQAEIFHEILEHRWFLSEAAGRDVGTTAAARDYFARVLPEVPEDLVTPVAAMTERDGVDDPEATAPDFELD